MKRKKIKFQKNIYIPTYFRGFTKFGIVKSTVSGVFQDLKLKISEGSDQN